MTTARQSLNKVPAITAYFWIIKALCATVGGSAADWLDTGLGLGLIGTSLLTTAVLAVVLVAQLCSVRYTPGLYWAAAVLVSIVGTLVTDDLTDDAGISLLVSTVVFAVLLAATFAAWYRRERTLSIHSIVTPSREAWYWGAVLLTFALGTVAGDLVAERLDLGYAPSVVLFTALIVMVVAARHATGMSAVVAFWLAYILTRPLGASVGDYVSAGRVDGGLGLGTLLTSGIFLAVILGLVTFLTVRRVDVTDRAQTSLSTRVS